MTNSEIRQSARKALQGNWGNAIILTLILLVVNAAVASIAYSMGEMLYLAAMILILPPIYCALSFTYLRFIRAEKGLEPAELFCTFRKEYYWKCVGACLLRYIYVVLWTLLLIVPGIIKSLAYSLVPYIITENPNIDSSEALKISEQMMQGNKTRLFFLLLGFWALSLLTPITLGLLMLWLHPYYEATMAKFYEEVKGCPTTTI